MAQERWKPRVTVAALIERSGQYLCVEERDANGRVVFNQPAGHLESGESLLEGVSRETLEETGHAFQPTFLTGVYHFTASNGECYLRFAFTGDISNAPICNEIDPQITAVHWLSREELLRKPLRSPIVIQSLDDAVAGNRFPLSIINTQLL